MKIYCPQCGSPTAYVGPKPKFCSSCGNALSALAKKEEHKNYTIHEDIDIEEEPSQQMDIGNMNRLDVEIESFGNSKVTIKEIMESQGTKTQGELNLPKMEPHQQTSDQVLEDFKKEAGTLRNKNAE